MKVQTVSVLIHSTSFQIFDLIHDYDKRLEWDSFLSNAVLLNDAERAGLNVVSRCSTRSALCQMHMETKYISFNRPRVAAVKMTKGPWFFQKFAASIRLKEISEDTTEVIYRYHFTLKSKILMFLQPIINKILLQETKMRLMMLKDYLEKSESKRERTRC